MSDYYVKLPVDSGGGGGGSGTVTSVDLATAATFLVASGGPVTTSGVLTINAIAQTGNTVLASPAGGGSGAPAFRSLVANDIPTLTASKISDFQATVSANTDVAANTAARHNAVTLGTANGLSLSVQALSLGLSSTSTTGALSSTDWNTFNSKQAAGSYITALTGDGTAAGPGSAALTLANTAVTPGAYTRASITVDSKGRITAASSNTAVTSVALSVPGTIYSVSGSPITSSGTLTLSLLTQTANTVFAGPTSGGAANPTFRALVSADIPNQPTTTKTANYTILSTDSIIFCDSSAGAFSLQLPNPSTVTGRIYRIIDSTGFFGTNNITLVRFAAENIEGLAASKILQTAWGFFNLVSDGTNWFIG